MTNKVFRALGLDGAAILALALAILVSMLGACLPGCQPPVPVCEPAAARCDGPTRVEVCTPEGQWMLADHCGDFGPGEWECGTAEGGVVACYPRTLTDPR